MLLIAISLASLTVDPFSPEYIDDGKRRIRAGASTVLKFVREALAAMLSVYFDNL
ncbi:MAG: hypothetical protein QW259_03250 [Pyrobaculum sp.]